LLTMTAESDQRSANVASRILRSAHRMGRLIDDVLDFTVAPLGGSIPLTRKAIDLEGLYQEVVLEAQAAHAGASVKVRVERRPHGRMGPRPTGAGAVESHRQRDLARRRRRRSPQGAGIRPRRRGDCPQPRRPDPPGVARSDLRAARTARTSRDRRREWHRTPPVYRPEPLPATKDGFP
jgi:hypothetical protein